MPPRLSAEAGPWGTVLTSEEPRRGEIVVEAFARLHFGVLDLRGSRGRWFGGIGASASSPSLLVSASKSDTLTVEGADAERATAFARRFLAHHGMTGGARVTVHRCLPPHTGLGSGTQLALAVARALAAIHQVECTPGELARSVDRARRSAIGTWTFAGGGLVVEGGRHPDRDECGPLIARLPFPETWRCVVVVPEGPPGLSGADESEAFASLPIPPEREVEHVAHLVLLTLLPAVAEGDLVTFGGALTEIQEVTGRWFAAAQGGAFAPGPGAEIVTRLSEWGACGVGQSSWGPAVYGIVDGQDAASRLATRAAEALGPRGAVYEGPFRSTGATVSWR